MASLVQRFNEFPGRFDMTMARNRDPNSMTPNFFIAKQLSQSDLHNADPHGDCWDIASIKKNQKGDHAKPSSPRSVRASRKELDPLSSSSDHSRKKKGSNAKRSDPLSSSSDHVRSSSSKSKSKAKSHHADDELSCVSDGTPLSGKRLSLKKAFDPLSSISDHFRGSGRKEVARDDLSLTSRPKKMMDSLSRFSSHIRSSGGPKKVSDSLTSLSDHGPRSRRNSTHAISPSPYITATPKRRVRFEMDEIDYYEYDGPTEEEKVEYFTSKANCKKGKQEAAEEGRAFSESNPNWVKSIEFLFDSPLKPRSQTNEITLEVAIRNVIISDARGMESKCSALMQRHQKWAVTSVLSRQMQLKSEGHRGRGASRSEQLRARLLSMSKCSTDFALLMAHGDAVVAADIHNEANV